MRRIFLLGPTLIALILLPLGCSVMSPLRQEVVWPATAQAALDYALTRQGSPYQLGAEGPDRFDCSGLIVWSYRQAYPQLKLRYGTEATIDATADGLWRYNVERIPPRLLRPGDLVFISSNAQYITHAGLFVKWLDAGRLQIVDATSATGINCVVVEDWPLEGVKRGARLIGVGRLKTVTETARF